MSMGKQDEWGFKENQEVHAAADFKMTKVLEAISNYEIKGTTGKSLIQLGFGDPTVFSCFRTSPVVEDALLEAIRSAKFNCYAPGVGISPARRAVAECLSRDIPYDLTTDDVFLTAGAEDAIHVLLTVLARPGANILLPRPSYPSYEAAARFESLEVRHFDLLPEKGWEVDLDRVESLADDKTVAIVLINPGNPCGTVFTFEHLKKIAETARKLGILVIADEAYAHQAFREKPFIPMGVFGDIAPVVTLGTLSKRWLVPGWRFGWIAVTDPNGILHKTGIADSIRSCLVLTAQPATVIQGAVPSIMKNTPDSFFVNINNILKDGADMVYDRINQQIPLVSCPHKPEGAMHVMLRLDLTGFNDVADDTDFCMKLANEESVILVPGNVMGLKNWVRMSFAADAEVLEDAIGRMTAFCLRHAKCY